MRVLLLICMPVVLLAQSQYQEPVPFLDEYEDYSFQENTEFQTPETLPGSYQQQVQREPVNRPGSDVETEPTEPGPLDCREEQYPCTRLYSVHKPCKQCLNSLCFYRYTRSFLISAPEHLRRWLFLLHPPAFMQNVLTFHVFSLSLRRVYVINKEICVRTVCAHEELLRADLCRDQFSRCGVMALSGQCASVGGSCGKSCGGC
uniref:Microfibril associated protein 2 n=1 Tax=Nothobranchius furzeri TaxID=105023 RepID=A0A8C6L8F6_NOTFU